MATAIVQKKLCSKCDKGNGIFTCDGCQQSFCRKHTDEHRQELAIQMDHIGQEHDIIQRDLNKETHLDSFLSRIDEWERESINKIQQAAEQARIDLRQINDESKKKLKTSINQMTDEFQSSLKSEDYTELDFRRWIDQLNEFRNELEKPLALNIIDNNDKRSVIRLIKISEQLNSCSSDQSICVFDQNFQIWPQSLSNTPEKFKQIDQKTALSEDGLVATCLIADTFNSSSVHGIQYYSSDIHYIRFRIEKKRCNYMFFGITTLDQAKFGLDFAASCHNGWWGLNCYVKDGVLKDGSYIVSMETGDEVTLVLDCDHRQIHLNHHRTKLNVQIPIDLQKCPFPWQILVSLTTSNDCVRILNNNE